MGCNACGRINPETMLECWLAVEKSYLEADFCKVTPDLDENQVRNVRSNIESVGKKIKEIENLIAERDKNEMAYEKEL